MFTYVTIMTTKRHFN